MKTKHIILRSTRAPHPPIVARRIRPNAELRPEVMMEISPDKQLAELRPEIKPGGVPGEGAGRAVIAELAPRAGAGVSGELRPARVAEDLEAAQQNLQDRLSEARLKTKQ